MSRVQLALNVSDLEEAVAFYSKLFATEPAKRRPGYANFAVTDPPLKLVLIEDEDRRAGDRRAGPEGALNHLGVEVEGRAEVAATAARLAAAGLRTSEQSGTTCCYAVQDKVWVESDGVAWETYTVLADAPVESGLAGDGTCCGGQATVPASAQACC